MTGNVGIVGGSSGVSNGATGRTGIKNLPAGTNPIDARVSSPMLADLLARGKDGGYPADIKLIYSVGGDLFNQAPNVNKMVQSLDGVEFLVVQDHFLTPTAQYADIVLPATTFWERNDVHTPWAGAGHYAIFMKQAIEPMGECRNDMDIFADLAARVGIEGYSDKSEMAWLRELTRDAVDDFDAFAENGVARFAAPDDAVAFAREIRDPEPPQVHHALRQDRDLFHGARRQPRPVRARPHPADPHLGAAVPGGHALSAQAADAEIARADPLDPQQPAGARPRRPRRYLAAPGGCRPRAASPTATSCACSTIAAPSCCRRA